MKKALRRCLTLLLAAILTFALCASAFAEEKAGFVDFIFQRDV